MQWMATVTRIPQVNTPKIKWVAQPKPTGPYRSFSQRGWPTGYYKEGSEPAFQIRCVDPYIPRNVKTHDHAELELWIADYRPREGQSPTGWQWKKMKQMYFSIESIKHALPVILEFNHDLMPSRYHYKKEKTDAVQQ